MTEPVELLEQRINENKEGIADEVIDVLWWILLIAHDLEIDLPKEFARKAQKNAKKYPVDSTKKVGKPYLDK